jgi:F-type H+-transporting ATPase subunit b
MPQLDFSTYPSQLIWLAIIFFGLYMVLSKFALPRIGGIIEQRRDRIAADLDEAKRLKEESEKALATYEAELAEAKTRAHAIAQEARDKLGTETDRQRADVEAQISAQLAEADARITESRDAAMAQVKDVAADTAGQVVQQLIGGRAVAKTKVTKAVNDALKG